jgi:hypothetical protein
LVEWDIRVSFKTRCTGAFQERGRKKHDHSRVRHPIHSTRGQQHSRSSASLFLAPTATPCRPADRMAHSAVILLTSCRMVVHRVIKQRDFIATPVLTPVHSEGSLEFNTERTYMYVLQTYFIRLSGILQYNTFQLAVLGRSSNRETLLPRPF